MVPASASATVSYRSPEYTRIWFTFSCHVSDGFSVFPPDMIPFTLRLPPVIFKWVRRFPWSSLEILYTFASNSCGYSGARAHLRIPPNSSSTPVSLRAEPKKQGKSRRSLIRRRISSSSTSPVSRYRSSSFSSHMAACSVNSSVPAPAKSAHPSSRRFCSSLIRCSRSVPGWSILLTKRKTGILYFASRRHKVMVWLCTPSAPLMTSTA